MSIQDYSKIREKVHLCDTLMLVKDTVIMHQDSIIAEQRNKIKEYNLLVANKDTTIKELKALYLVKQDNAKWYNCKEPYIIAIGAFIIGLIISR